MKGLIIAGGAGTRLHPLTNPLNKHLLPVYDRPMIMHVIDTLVKGGVTDIMLLLNGKHAGLFMEMLEDGSSLGCKILYAYVRRTTGPGGTLLLAEHWVGKEDVAVILGDSVYFTLLALIGKKGPHIFTMKLQDGDDDPSKYGQVRVKGSRVTALVDKPKKRFSDLIQTACFIFPPDVFARVRKLQFSPDGELTIGALVKEYVDEGSVTHTMLPPRSYIDCGTPEALHKASVRIRKMRR